MALDVNKIDLGQLADELRDYESQWVAISSSNKIVGSGSTPTEALANIDNLEEVILFNVPPVHCSIAP